MHACMRMMHPMMDVYRILKKQYQGNKVSTFNKACCPETTLTLGVKLSRFVCSNFYYPTHVSKTVLHVSWVLRAYIICTSLLHNRRCISSFLGRTCETRCRDPEHTYRNSLLLADEPPVDARSSILHYPRPTVLRFQRSAHQRARKVGFRLVKYGKYKDH